LQFNFGQGLKQIDMCAEFEQKWDFDLLIWTLTRFEFILKFQKLTVSLQDVDQ